jgi:hypothetical protein
MQEKKLAGDYCMKINNLRYLVALTFVVCAFLVGLTLSRPAESARRYEYRVISITGMTELRTHPDVQQGRMKTIENVVNEQSVQGWELFQADGYVLYFRR